MCQPNERRHTTHLEGIPRVFRLRHNGVKDRVRAVLLRLHWMERLGCQVWCSCRRSGGSRNAVHAAFHFSIRFEEWRKAQGGALLRVSWCRRTGCWWSSCGAVSLQVVDYSSFLAEMFKLRRGDDRVIPAFTRKITSKLSSTSGRTAGTFMYVTRPAILLVS